MGNQKVLLADMPEILYRQILANSLELDELQDIFKFVIAQTKKLTIPSSIREGTYNFLPHIFQAPKDLYMTAVLKEAFQACTNVVAMIGKHHYQPIKSYWAPPPEGINF